METSVPKNYLPEVTTQASVILKQQGVVLAVLISSFLQSFTDGPGQDVFCELNKFF